MARPTLLRLFLLDFSTPPELVSVVRNVVRSVDPMVLAARIRALASVDVADKLRKLQVPVLYIASGRDRMIGMRGARQVLAAAPNADVRTIDAPHLILQTKPRDAANLIMTFLKEKGISASIP
jgi:pimeloyl-ACP methyl ester carboxylesterase